MLEVLNFCNIKVHFQYVLKLLVSDFWNMRVFKGNTSLGECRSNQLREQVTPLCSED